MSQLSLSFFGSFRAVVGDSTPVQFSTRSARALLIYLAMHPGVPFEREHLAALLWPESARDQAQASLRQTLYRLRQSLTKAGAADDHLIADATSICFNAAANYRLDVHEFTNLLDQCDTHPHPQPTKCQECAQRMARAISLYTSDFLTGFALADAPAFEEWQAVTQERLHTRAMTALETLARYQQTQRDYNAAIATLQQILALEPWREESHVALMRCYLLSGKRHLALQQYDTLTRTLAAELNTVPGAEAQTLYNQLRHNTPDAKPTSSPVTNPYCGLNAFEQEQAAYFFGREALLARLVDELDRRPAVLLVGVSGCGKSSLLKAGVLPTLHVQNEARQAVIMRPGEDPFAALAEALLPFAPYQETDLGMALSSGQITLPLFLEQSLFSRQGSAVSLVILIDQFEEVFARVQDEAVLLRFLDLILETTEADFSNNRVSFLMALRADFLGKALVHGKFAGLVQENMLALGALSPVEMARAVEMPAQMQNVFFEPGLVTRLIQDVGDDPGRLPLLQFCLSRLWQEQNDGWITHAAYDEIEGLSGSLNHYADGIVARLEPVQQVLVKHILLQLVHVMDEIGVVRRQGLRTEFSDEAWTVVQSLVNARLLFTDRLSSGEESVELVHEALIYDWQRLCEWIQADRSFGVWQGQIRPIAQQWARNGDKDMLLRGLRLAEAERWLQDRREYLSATVVTFVEASQSLRQSNEEKLEAQRQSELVQAQRLAAVEHERAESEARSGRRLRFLTTGLALAFMFAMMLTVYAVTQQRRALTNETIARAEADARATESAVRQEAEQAALAAQATAESERQAAERQTQLADSRHLSAQALRFAQTQPDLAALLSLEALQRTQDPLDQIALFSNFYLDPRLDIFLHRSDKAIFDITYTQDASHLLMTDESAVALRLDLKTGEVRRYETPSTGGVAFSSDGRYVALSLGLDLQLWNTETDEQIRSWASDLSLSGMQFFSGDSRRFFVKHPDTISVFDTNTGALLRRFSLPISGNLLSVNKDGSLLVVEEVGAAQVTMHLVDVASMQIIGKPMIGHSDGLHAVRFSPDGSLVATASFDGTVRLWDTRTGELVGLPLVGHGSRVLSVSFSPDGTILASGGTDNRIFLWDVKSGAQVGSPLLGHHNWVRGLAFHPDGRTLVSADANGVIIRWNVAHTHVLNGHNSRVRDVAISPDGNTLVTSSFDRSLQIWDAKTLTRRRTITTPHPNSIIRAMYSPNGRYFATADAAGAVVIWNTNQWRPIGELRSTHNVVVIGMAFSPDSQWLATGDFHGTVVVQEVSSGAVMQKWQAFDEHVWALSLAFSSDGSLLAAGSTSGEIHVYAVETLMTSNKETSSDLEPVLPSIQGHANWVTDLLFTPDGRQLVSASSDNSIQVWDLSTGTSVGAPLIGHAHQVWEIAFDHSQPTLTLVSLDSQGNILWWDWERRTLDRPILATGIETEAMALSPNGDFIYLGTFDNTARVWQVNTNPWITRACGLAHRNFATDEWQQYLPNTAYQPTCPE